MKDLQKRLEELEKGFNQLKADMEARKGERLPVTERIKTFDDVCVELGYTINHMNGMKKDEIAYFKLKMIAKVLNEGWEPDWNDTEQLKYFPWFTLVGGNANYGANAGFGSVSSDYGASGTGTRLGGRLSFKSKSLAEYAGKTFIDIYKDFITG